jgi:hypothetical protein
MSASSKLITAQPARRTAALAAGARYLGALSVLGIGAIHLWAYFADYYRVIPIIGPLFAANFVGATVLGLALLSPVQRLRRIGPLLPALLALSAIGFAASTIAGLAISEASTMFGFHETGYRTSIDLSLVLEIAVIVLLSLFVALQAPQLARWRHTPGTAAQRG